MTSYLSTHLSSLFFLTFSLFFEGGGRSFDAEVSRHYSSLLIHMSTLSDRRLKLTCKGLNGKTTRVSRFKCVAELSRFTTNSQHKWERRMSDCSLCQLLKLKCCRNVFSFTAGHFFVQCALE